MNIDPDWLFQSTLPREERLGYNASGILYRYFNPRSHERSDKGFEDLCNLISISIHAPTRGATKNHNTDISKVYDFNPRSHERSDTKLAMIAINNDISIHAPTRGATCQACVNMCCKIISIHAPTRGATHKGEELVVLFANFNPRSHERSDSNIAQKICLFLYNTDNKYIIR